jgi:hypothetical protein
MREKYAKQTLLITCAARKKARREKIQPLLLLFQLREKETMVVRVGIAISFFL